MRKNKNSLYVAIIFAYLEKLIIKGPEALQKLYDKYF